MTKMHALHHLVGYKQWADRGLYEVVKRTFSRLSADDQSIVLRILDHIHVTDQIFQHHLQGRSHGFSAPRSERAPNLEALNAGNREVDGWYVNYVDGASTADLAQPLDFTFTSGARAHMTRAEVLLHVCLHGTYHRGSAGILLQKNGIKPNEDRMTDYLEQAA